MFFSGFGITSDITGQQKESVSSGGRDVDSDIEEITNLDEILLSSWDHVVASSIYGPNVPTIRPRRRYTGARNVATVKDGDAIRSA